MANVTAAYAELAALEAEMICIYIRHCSLFNL